ncbi:MAG: hypothetical protein R2939_06705 [Kofleriaceae bacterium]
MTSTCASSSARTSTCSCRWSISSARDALRDRITAEKVKANPLIVDFDEDDDEAAAAAGRSGPGRRAPHAAARGRGAVDRLYVSADGTVGRITVRTAFSKTEVGRAELLAQIGQQGGGGRGAPGRAHRRRRRNLGVGRRARRWGTAAADATEHRHQGGSVGWCCCCTCAATLLTLVSVTLVVAVLIRSLAALTVGHLNAALSPR